MKGVLAFFASMSGRIFLILSVGMALAAVIAASLTIANSDREFERQLVEREADRIANLVAFLDALPEPTRSNYLANAIPRVRPAPPQIISNPAPDTLIESALATRGVLAAGANVKRVPLSTCVPHLRVAAPGKTQEVMESAEVRDAERRLAPGRVQTWPLVRTQSIPERCWIVSARLNDGANLTFAIDSPRVDRERRRLLDPVFLTLLVLAGAGLAYAVARIASAPLKRLAGAAAQLGQDLDRAPLRADGPGEVRRAAEAFNAMQLRLQQHVSERTRMLAAITHDLQTPLTRLRLRLERVEDANLRDRLVADLNAMKALIDEGLELARSTETAESKVPLDLDSLLESIVEDAIDAGGQATFEHGCDAVLPLRPLAARRLISNLVDNALKYGGSASLSATREHGEIRVRIRDRGPGLPDELLERVFEPFFRGDDSRSRQTGGVGLGLTIARALAEKNGARVTLQNSPDGGLIAMVAWPS